MSQIEIEIEIETSIQQTDKGFSYWLGRPYVDDTLRTQLAKADILIVPQEGFRDHPGPVFPIKTEQVWTYLRENAPSSLTVDVCIQDAQYQELALHSAMEIIGTFVITALAAPVFTTLLSNYIQKKLDVKKDTVNIKVAVCEKPGDDRGVMFAYDGPAHEFKPTIDKLLESYRQNGAQTAETVEIRTDSETSANIKTRGRP